MAYADVEEALAIRLNNISGFGTAAGTGNITKSDFRVLTRGVGSAVIIEYGGFDQRRAEMAGDHEIDWRFNLDLFVRIQDELAGANELGTARQLIIDEINQRPKLGTSIILDAIISSGDPTPEDIEMGGVRYNLEILRLTATETISVSYAE